MGIRGWWSISQSLMFKVQGVIFFDIPHPKFGTSMISLFYLEECDSVSLWFPVVLFALSGFPILQSCA